MWEESEDSLIESFETPPWSVVMASALMATFSVSMIWYAILSSDKFSHFLLVFNFFSLILAFNLLSPQETNRKVVLGLEIFSIPLFLYLFFNGLFVALPYVMKSICVVSLLILKTSSEFYASGRV